MHADPGAERGHGRHRRRHDVALHQVAAQRSSPGPAYPSGRASRSSSTSSPDAAANRSWPCAPPVSSARRTVGDHPAVVDDHHPVGEQLGLVQQVGGQQDRHPVGPGRPQQIPDQVPGLRVHPGGRLVQEQQLGPADQGHRQAQPLHLATGQPAHRGPAPPRPARARPAASPGRAGGPSSGRSPRASRRRGPRRASRRPAASRRSAAAARRSAATDRGRARCTVPPSGRANPVQTSSVLVLPAPFGPSSATSSPRGTVKDSPSTARSGPNRRTSPSTPARYGSARRSRAGSAGHNDRG